MRQASIQHNLAFLHQPVAGLNSKMGADRREAPGRARRVIDPHLGPARIGLSHRLGDLAAGDALRNGGQTAARGTSAEALASLAAGGAVIGMVASLARTAMSMSGIAAGAP
jgi:hypothetical protein